MERGNELRREGLTKIWMAIQKYGDDGDTAQLVAIEEKLASLGGPDPAVEQLDGPDSAAESDLQHEIDTGGNASRAK